MPPHALPRGGVLKRTLPLVLAGLAAVSAACLAGAYPAAPGDVLAVLARAAGLAVPGPADPALPTVVMELRLTRALLAYGVGAALAVAGAAFQGVLRNPLADPFTLGVSGGAAFGAALSLTLGLGAALGTTLATPACALAGGGTTLAAVLALSRLAGGLRRETVVLSGTAEREAVAAVWLSHLKTAFEALGK